VRTVVCAKVTSSSVRVAGWPGRAAAVVIAVLPSFRAGAGLGSASRIYQAAFTVIRSRVAGIW
jgi:hypothetical protein